MDGQQSDRSIPDVAYMDSYLLFFGLVGSPSSSMVRARVF